MVPRVLEVAGLEGDEGEQGGELVRGVDARGGHGGYEKRGGLGGGAAFGGEGGGGAGAGGGGDEEELGEGCWEWSGEGGEGEEEGGEEVEFGEVHGCGCGVGWVVDLWW